MEKQKVPFDPGYSDLVSGFPPEALKYLEEISALKQNHRKKFEFSRLETQLLPVLRMSAAFYLGCLLWGSYLYWNYKEDSREIEGNHILSLSEEEKEQLSNNSNIDFIIEFIEKFNNQARRYMQRSSRIPEEYSSYFYAYKKFMEANDSFKNLKYTRDIKLVEEVDHFKSFDKQKLEELKNKICEIIESQKLDAILNLGFYK